MSCESSKIECRKNLFVLKLDNFFKHVGKRKAKVTTKGVQTSNFFYSKNATMHKMKAINLNLANGLNVLHLVRKRDGNDDKQKLVQFTIGLHLLMEGRPMIDFEGLKLLFKQLGVKTMLESSRLIVQHGSWLNNYTKRC